MYAHIVDIAEAKAVFLHLRALALDVPVGAVVKTGEKAVRLRVGIHHGDKNAVAAVEQRHIDARPADDDGVIADAHIYDRHIPIIEKMLAEPEHPAPQFTLDPAVTDFYAFTPDSVRLENYQFSPFEDKIPIAV